MFIIYLCIYSVFLPCFLPSTINLFLSHLFNDVLINEYVIYEYSEATGRMIVNNVLRGMCKDATMSCIKILSPRLPEEIE
jgi:hypothetical protein